jgi:hypothetical protein
MVSSGLLEPNEGRSLRRAWALHLMLRLTRSPYASLLSCWEQIRNHHCDGLRCEGSYNLSRGKSNLLEKDEDGLREKKRGESRGRPVILRHVRAIAREIWSSFPRLEDAQAHRFSTPTPPPGSTSARPARSRRGWWDRQTSGAGSPTCAAARGTGPSRLA